MYYLMIQYKVVLELFQTIYLLIYANQSMASEIIPLSFVLLNLESIERKGKIQKFEYLKNKKSFFDEIKSYFYSF